MQLRPAQLNGIQRLNDTVCTQAATLQCGEGLEPAVLHALGAVVKHHPSPNRGSRLHISVTGPVLRFQQGCKLLCFRRCQGLWCFATPQPALSGTIELDAA